MIKDEKLCIYLRVNKYKIIKDYYENSFRTKSFGAERASEIYPILREHALEKMKGLFSYEELEMLLNILNLGTDRFEISKDVIIQKIKDSMTLQPSLTAKQKEMIDRIINKIDKLDFYQAIILSEWLATYNSYLESYRGKKQTISLKKYAERLL